MAEFNKHKAMLAFSKINIENPSEAQQMEIIEKMTNFFQKINDDAYEKGYEDCLNKNFKTV